MGMPICTLYTQCYQDHPAVLQGKLADRIVQCNPGVCFMSWHQPLMLPHRPVRICHTPNHCVCVEHKAPFQPSPTLLHRTNVRCPSTRLTISTPFSATSTMADGTLCSHRLHNSNCHAASWRICMSRLVGVDVLMTLAHRAFGGGGSCCTHLSRCVHVWIMVHMVHSGGVGDDRVA